MQGKVTDSEKLTAQPREKAENPRAKRILLKIAHESARGCGAFLFGLSTLLFKTNPLGVALLCATGGNILPILLGLIASALWSMEHPWFTVATYLAAALIRAVSTLLSDSPSKELRREAKQKLRDARRKIEGLPEFEESEAPRPSRFSALVRKLRQAPAGEAIYLMREELTGLFNESIVLRMVTSAVCILPMMLYRWISGGMQYYDLYALFFCVLVAPAAVLVYSVFLDKRSDLPILQTVSAGALLFSMIWASSDLLLYTLPLANILSLFFTLYITEHEGAAKGAGAAILCGLASEPLQIPAYLIGCLVYRLFRGREKHGMGVPAACLVALLWSVYSGGLAAMTTWLTSYLLAGAVFSLVILIEKSLPTAAVSGDPIPDTAAKLHHATVRHEDTNTRLRGISDAFSSLSEMFYNLSDRRRRPGTLDLRRICDLSFDAYCPDCPNRTVCWGLEYTDTLDVVNRLSAGLHKRGKVNREQIPEAFASRCDSMDEIVEEINRRCAVLTGELLRDNRTEIFAMDYEAAANILNDALEEDEGEYKFDPQLSAKISDYLGDAGIRAQSVTVYGKRRPRVLVRGVDIDHATVTAETLRCDLGEMCGLELTNPTFEVENNSSTMILQARRQMSVYGAQNNLPAEGGISGDAVNLFSNNQDFFYALISDGMGSGKEAAAISNLCSTFLEKMLRAGNRASTSLRMLNNLILSRSQNSATECSSTIDLVEFDLITGNAAFIKGGAAPSFVVRGSTVHRIQSGSAPIGIIRRLDTKTTTFPLRPGDTVILISDGVQQNDPDCRWLTEYLKDISGKEPAEIVYQICLHASTAESHDDCSAIALRIGEA